MKRFKIGDDVYIKGKVASIDTEDELFPLEVATINDSFWVEKQDMENVFHLSDIQQNQFTDKELELINKCIRTSYFISNFESNSLVDKINNLIKSPEEKQLLELANKLGYKIEKI